MPNLIERLQIRLAQLGLILSHPLGQFTRPQLPPPPNPKSILIIRLDHLGDLVMSQPAIAAIHSYFPTAKITLLCASWNIPIAAMIPGIDEIITLNAPWHRGGDGWKAVRHFLAENRSRRFDLGIALRQWLGDLWLLSRMNCNYRLGYSMVGIKPLLSYAVHLPNQPMHAVDLALNVLSPLSTPVEPGTSPALVPTPKGDAEAVRFMEQHKLQKDGFIAMHLHSRQKPHLWSLSEAAKLILLIKENMNLPVVLLGGPGEMRFYEELILGANNLINAVGELTIGGVFSLMTRAKAFIGVDSGPAHLAGATGIPTFVLWSGQVPWQTYAPRGIMVKLMTGACPESPCYEPDCPIEGKPCMAGFTAESVLSELMSLIS